MARNSYLIVTRDLLANKSISVTARLLFAQLLDHRNRHTGQCNPRAIVLADELGISRRTVDRALKELRAAEMLTVKRTGRASAYELTMRQNGASDATSCLITMRQNGASAASGPLYELNLKGTYARAPKRAPHSLPKETAENTAPAPRRKSITSETLEAYYRLYAKKAE
jgi:DNA-binding transcriptional ArsR family regulator